MGKSERDPKFEELLRYLKQNRGFDFTGYKRSSLMRRVQRRMFAVEIDDFEEYRDYLEVHPDEFNLLFNTILINVTSFFRDEPAWDFLAEEIVPRILESGGDGQPVRVWSAGCASGEEAYTLVMVLAEAMGVEACRRRVKVYATDVDEEALAHARQASYRPEAVESVPDELRRKYFEASENAYTFNNDLRRVVIFGRHDLMSDAPISRLDLLVCRNTLIYFNAEAQRNILARFHFALNNDGFLFMGKAEMLMTHAHLFEPVSPPQRVFAKVPQVDLRDRMIVMAQAGDRAAADQLGTYVRLREAAFDTSPLAQVVIDREGNLALVNARARRDFDVDHRDIGRPFKDLELSYRPAELRSIVEQARVEGRTIDIKDVRQSLPEGETRYLDVEAVPLTENGGQIMGVSIHFRDVTRYHRLQEELQRSHQELETAYEELQSTNEELETTNEELQSSNEELQTTNEELQSTNEEMETMNEELQSSNEELHAINEELRQRTVELNHVNAFLESILSSVGAAVVVVDRDLRILLWNDQAEDLWGLEADEVKGRSILGLDIGLPVEKLAEPLHRFLSGKGDTETSSVEGYNRRGQRTRSHVSYDTLNLGSSDSPDGVVMLIETDRCPDDGKEE